MTRIAEQLNRIEALLSSQTVKPLTLREAAAYLAFSHSHLYRLTSQSLIPHYKPGGKKIYFLKSELDRWLLRNRVSTREEIASHV